MVVKAVCMDMITALVLKVEGVSVANCMLEKVVEAAWDRYKINSAWEWLVDDPELRYIIPTRIRELDEDEVEVAEESNASV